MQKHHDTIQEDNGDIITTATVTIYDAGTGSPSSIFEDDETTPISNPFTVSDANYADDGSFYFKAANGDYNIKIVNGSNTKWKNGVKLFDYEDAHPLSVYNKSVPPTVNDDSDDGYGYGSVWVDVVGGDAYRCLDATVGAAVWELTTLTIAEASDIAFINALIFG